MRVIDVLDTHFLVCVSKNCVSGSHFIQRLVSWFMPWYAVVSQAMHVFEVVLSNAVLFAHGATHAPLRNVVPGLHLSGAVQSVLSSPPQILIRFV